MELQAIKTANYLDILFDNRNKAYGSYELRKTYNKRTLTAFLLVLSAILITCAYFALFNNHVHIQPQAQPIGVMTICDITPPPAIIPKQEITPPPATSKTQTVKHTPPVIVPDEKTNPDDLPPENHTLENAIAGTANTEGESNTTASSPIAGNTNGTNAVAPEPPVTRPFAAVQQMPEFNGSINDYLKKQLTYPVAARESGVEGKVIVQFVVNEDGHISYAKILRGIGGGCNEEALRVVNSMPKWKPGMQNGLAVKVYFTLPIRFELG